MNARKYSLIIILIQFLALGFATRLNANFSALNLKNGDIIAIQGKDKNSFCHANKHFQLVCNKKNKITEKSLFKIKIISAEENIIALSVGPDFNNYCQYDESSKRVLCDYEEEQPGSWEWFQWVPVKKNNLLENMFALKSGTTGYKSFCGQNNNNVTCDKKYINDQGTTFQYYILQKGKSNQNKFLDLAKILENDYQRELDSDSIVLEAREESTENEKSKAEAPKNIEKKKNSFKPVLSATGEEEEEESGDEEDESGDEGVSELLEELESSADEVEEAASNSEGKEGEEDKEDKNEAIEKKNCTAKNWKKFIPNLSGCNLKFVNFKSKKMNGWDFSHTILSFTQFENARLVGAKFNDAELNSTNFKGAYLKGAHFLSTKIKSSNFEKADLRNTKFERTTVNSTTFTNSNLSDAHFEKTTFKNVSFNGANLSYSQMVCDPDTPTFGTDHSNTFLGVNFKKANLEHCDLSETNLSKINFYKADLAYINLTGANLTGANLELTNLSHSNLTKANLTKAEIDDTIIFHTIFDGANFTKATIDTEDVLESSFLGAVFVNTEIDNTKFIECDFTDVDLNKAILSGSNGFLATKMSGAKLNKLDLTDVNLLGAKLDGAKLKMFKMTFKNKSHKHKSQLCVSYNSYDQADKIKRGHIKCTPVLKPGQSHLIKGVPADATYIRASITGDTGQNIGNRTWSAINEDQECTSKGLLFQQAGSC